MPTTITYREAVVRALDEEMARDENVIFFGEDVAKAGGVTGKYGFPSTGVRTTATGSGQDFKGWTLASTSSGVWPSTRLDAIALARDSKPLAIRE